MGTVTKVLALIYVLIGLYLINFQIKLVSLDFLNSIQGWIMFVGGVIILIHGVRFFMKRTKKTFENF